MYESFFHSFIIAQVFGLFLVILSVIMMAKASFYREMMATIETKSMSMFSSAVIWLFLGLFLVLIHHEWLLEVRLLVTILGWAILLKSLLWLAFPECMMKATKSMYASPWYYISLIIMLIYGMVLMSKGFYYPLMHTM